MKRNSKGTPDIDNNLPRNTYKVTNTQKYNESLKTGEILTFGLQKVC